MRLQVASHGLGDVTPGAVATCAPQASHYAFIRGRDQKGEFRHVMQGRLCSCFKRLAQQLKVSPHNRASSCAAGPCGQAN